MSLEQLIHDPGCTPAELAAYLDGLEPAQRRREALALGPRAQARLWERVAPAPPLDLLHFVPADLPDQQQVIHHGRNTLPLFSAFQKRFCRPPGESPEAPARLFGYNEGPTRPVIGPGYFVARPTAGRPGWEGRGAVVVDYFLVPDQPVAPGWPPVVPNSRGAQRLVFHRTRDFMRRVSRQVSIGRAWKEERRLPAYFVLCRQEG